MEPRIVAAGLKELGINDMYETPGVLKQSEDQLWTQQGRNEFLRGLLRYVTLMFLTTGNMKDLSKPACK